MPYQSDKQRRFMHAKHPGIAAKWDAEIRRKKKVRKSLTPVAKSKKGWTQGLGAAAIGGALANQIPPVQSVYEREKKRKKRVRKSEDWVIKSYDPHFNTAVAQRVFDLVSKMDDDTAEMFAYFVVCEMLDEDISKNHRVLQRHLDEVVSKRLSAMKRAVVAVAKRDGADEDAVSYAQAISEIEKARKNQYDYNYQFKESAVRRNQMGQFATKVKVNPQAKPWSDAQMAAMGHTDAVNHAKKLKGAAKLSPDAKSQYQQEYLQLAHFLDTFQGQGGDAGDTVLLHVKNKNSGQTHSVPSLKGTKVPTGAWDPNTEQVVGIEARPNQMKMAGASYNLGQALGASPDAAAGMAFTGERLDRNLKPFADDWTRPGAEDYLNTNARTYQRVQTGSQFVGAVARPGGAVQTAARLAEFAGSHGPEAEKVLGPAARKTAYRYRGTEKAPDAHIVTLYGRAINDTKINAPDTGEDEGPLRGRKPPEGAPPPPSQMGARRAAAVERAPTWRERDAGRRIIQQQLGFNIPNRQLYGLQLAAGNTPPSEGILLNRDGQIVTQAIGYGDDHYLPFNLKNLKALKGGEYIRTRSVGGPTSEDIYTGLLTGARQVTVISRSGTFTVTFDETLRGGRRYNDKAMRMTDRYEHLLDALESEQVDAKPIPDHVRNRIQDEVDRDYGSWPPAEQRKMFRQKEEEYKAFGTGLTKEDKNYIDARARLAYEHDPTTDMKEVKSKLTADVMADKEFKFRLNGEGYKSALQALQEQFPYYIKVNATPRREPDLAEPEKDKGYVMPKHNRPVGALHGYYNPRIAGEGKEAYQSGSKAGEKTGKVKASEADYQNYRYARRPTQEAEETATAAGAENTVRGGSSGVGGDGGGVPDDMPGNETDRKQRTVKENIRESMDENEFGNVAWNLIAKTRRAPDYDRDNPMAGLVTAGEKNEFLKQAKTPEGYTRLTQMITAAAGTYGANLPEYQAFTRAKAKVNRKNYTDQLAFEWGETPYKFEGDAYRKTADMKHAQDKLNDLSRRSLPITSERTYAEMSDSAKQEELAKLHFLAENRSSLKGTAAQEKELFATMGITNSANAAKLVNDKDPEAIRKQAKRLHQIRTIQANQDAQMAASPTGGEVDPARIADAVKTQKEREAGGPIANIGTLAPKTTEQQKARLAEQIQLLNHKADLELGSFPDAARAVRSQVEAHQAALDHLNKGGTIPKEKMDQFLLGGDAIQAMTPAELSELGIAHWDDD